MARKRESKLEQAKIAFGEEVIIQANDSQIASIAELARLQHSMAIDIAQMEDVLVAMKERYKQIREVDLPTAMEEAHMEKFITEDGLIVERKPDVTANITEVNKPAAYQWLVDNQFQGLIKTEIKIEFDRGDHAAAIERAEELRGQGLDCVVKEFIHPQTLKSFVKERIADTESEVEFPLDLFGARPYNVANVKPRKK